MKPSEIWHPLLVIRPAARLELGLGKNRWESLIKKAHSECRNRGILAASLCTLFLVEVISAILCARAKMLKPFEDHERERIKPEGREYGQRALTLGGLTFASIAILFDVFRQSLAEVSDVFFLLALSLGFLFLSYSTEVLVLQARIFWVIEDKSLSMGYLAIVFALVVLFQPILPSVFVVLCVLALALVVTHVCEYWSDLESWRQRKHS
jgi:hypothetical protein